MGAMAFKACNPTIEAPTPSAGSADLSRYIAVGNSLTAGRSDDGFTRAMQEKSYPNLMAKQFEAVGGGVFKQPLASEGTGSGPLLVEELGTNECGGLAISLNNYATANDWADNVADQGPFNNLGVSYMRVQDVFQPNFHEAITNLCPTCFDRMVEDPSKSYVEIVAEAVTAIQPTFFTNWLGVSDAILYGATGGGYVDTLILGPISQVDVTAPPITPIIPISETFRINYNAVLDTIMKNGPIDGLLTTIPDVTTLPFFTTVASNLLTDEEKASPEQNLLQLTSTADCETRIPIWYKKTSDIAPSIHDTLMAKEGDYIVQLASLYLGKPVDLGNGEIVPFGFDKRAPLHNSYVLDASEAQVVQEGTIMMNGIIEEIAAERNLGLVDMYAFFNELQEGMPFEGIDMSSVLVSGGAFSLDGLHPCDRGYAIIANAYIEAINERFDANILTINITQYPCVVVP